MKSTAYRLFVVITSIVLGLPLAADAAQFPSSVASGDPRPESVVLWTRLVDEASNGADLTADLEVATDSAFENIALTKNNLVAKAAHDYVIKVMATGLSPATVYYYRFKSGESVSPVGRTKTAPAAGSDTPVKFAFLSCQDYIGRYYNTLADLLSRHPDDLDFVVYLGDYIYETTGDPQFQSTNPERAIEFDDVAGAIELGSGESTYYAAASLDNYRQLYKIYREDPVLQRLHELYPIIVIWDDHEFSDDNWGATATYFDAFAEEKDELRKRSAEQAFFEYVPVSVGATESGLALQEADLFPNTTLYRYFDFGANLRLVLPDYRTFRPDHLVPEDAFPGAIIMDEAAVQGTLAVALGLTAEQIAAQWPALKSSFDAYVGIDAESNAALKAGLTQIVTGAYMLEGLSALEAATRAADVVAGNVSAAYINSAFAAAGQAAPLTSEIISQLPRGLSFAYLGKTTLFSDVGSRYFLVRDSFALYAGYRAALDAGTQNAYGLAQFQWVQTALTGSEAKWNVFGSSVSFAPIGVDFSDSPIPLPAEFPSLFRQNFQLNADHWDGFPNGRASLLDLLSANNGIIISGDIHASFVSGYEGAAGLVPEFTGSSVSSETFKEIARGLAVPLFGDLEGIDQLVELLDVFVYDHVRKEGVDAYYAETGSNGYVVMEIDEAHAIAEYRTAPVALVSEDMTAPEMDGERRWLFDTRAYKVSKSEEGAMMDTWPVAGMTENPLTGMQEGWLGMINTRALPWVWHAQHGYLYVVATPLDDESVFLYDTANGWLFTNPSIYPLLYSFMESTWLYYAVGTDNPRYFFNFASQSWFATID